MANFQEVRLQTGFVQLESVYGTVLNSTGASTVANGDAFGFSELTMQQDQAELTNPVKTTNLGQIDGQLSRKSPVSVTVAAPLVLSGSAGTVPDLDALYQAAFGRAAVVVSSTSVTYTPDINNYSVSLFDFVSPSTTEQRIAASCIVNSMEIDFGSDWAGVRFSLSGKSLIESKYFSSLDTEGKCGLTAFPSQPASPSFAYTPILGHKGSATLDGNAYTTILNGKITLTSGRAQQQNCFGTDYSQGVTSGMRNVNINWTMLDDDSANLTSLKNKGRASTAVTVVFVLGVTAGNILTATARVKLGRPTYGVDGTLRTVNFNATGRISSVSANDDLVIALT